MIFFGYFLVLGMENDVMTHFIEDIDQIVKSTPAQKAAANGNQSQILNDSSNEVIAIFYCA